MVAIAHDEISSDRDTGLTVLALAVEAAPALGAVDLPEDARRDAAVAILRRVAADLPAAGMGRVSQQSRNGTSVSLRESGAALSAEYRSVLRGLYGDGARHAAAPVGDFPASGLVAEMWPEP